MAVPVLGTMSRHVDRPEIEQVADVISSLGLTVVQLSMESAGVDPMPGRLPASTVARIARAFENAGVRIAAVSGTFNIIDPDRDERDRNMARFIELCGTCSGLGTRVVTTSSGTRNPYSMWRAHPGNHLTDAWTEMVDQTGIMADAAARAGVVMAVEPETANVVDSTARAKSLIDAVRSPGLGITFDPANFYYPSDLTQMAETLEAGFRDIGGHIALAHAKDVIAPPAGGTHCHYRPAGQGVLDYPLYLRLLEKSGYTNGLIMHSLSEADIPRSRDFIFACSPGL